MRKAAALIEYRFLNWEMSAHRCRMCHRQLLAFPEIFREAFPIGIPYLIFGGNRDLILHIMIGYMP